MDKLLIIIGTVLVLLLGVYVLKFQVKNKPNNTKEITPITNTPSIQNEFSNSVSPTVTQRAVPLPQETDIIRTYFNLIDERRIGDAVGMMVDSITSDDSQKQAWGVQLNAMKSVKVLDISSSTPEEWSADEHTYKVTLDIIMDPSSAHTVIPFYGYDSGKNVRWITLRKIGKMWKIAGIGTGP